MAVQTFSLLLPGWPDASGDTDPVGYIEQEILKRIPDGLRLIRWAVVSVSDSDYRCEGAYLTIA